jgi:hypothetical protein
MTNRKQGKFDKKTKDKTHVNSVVNTEYNGKKDHTHSKHTPQWRLTIDKDKYHLQFLGKCYFIQKFPINVNHIPYNYHLLVEDKDTR